MINDKIFSVVCEKSIANMMARLSSVRGNVELRVDYADDMSEGDIKTLAAAAKGRKVILTCRTKQEGGQFKGTEKTRIALLKCALNERFTYTDIELATLQKNNLRFTKSERSKLLISYHNFAKTPSLKSLETIKKKMLTHKPAVIKIATMVNKETDIATLTSFLMETIEEGVKVVLIGMGAKGMLTRVFFPLIGSEATYAPTTKQTALGQLSREQLMDFSIGNKERRKG